MPNKLNTEKFIELARKVHGNKYDYSKVNYTGAENKICIICPVHGEFWQTPHRHLRGDRCPACSSRAKMNNKTFIDKARETHGDKYNYSKVNYIDSKTKVCIICPEHGEFWQTPASHLMGCGCPVCKFIRVGNSRKLNTEKFIAKANEVHKGKYYYDKVEYVKAFEPVIITCPLHGDFLQAPHKHLYGHGCPICGEKNNITEIRIYETLKEMFPDIVYQKTFDFLKEKSAVQKIDFYLPIHNIGIEVNGRQHYMPVDIFGGEVAFKLTRARDIKKYSLCKKHGIKIIYYTPPKMKSYIKDYFAPVYTSLTDLINDIKNDVI